MNAIGGHLTSKNLLCKTCNSKFGEESDAELARQLNFYSNVLMIKRDNGNPQPVIMERPSTGEKYKVDSTGKPQIKDPVVIQKENVGQQEIKVQARSMDEAKKILKGFKRKYKNIDIEDVLSKAQHVEEQIDESLKINLKIGGRKVLPSILKTANSFYIKKTQDIDSVRNEIEDLKPISLCRQLDDHRPVVGPIFLNGPPKMS